MTLISAVIITFNEEKNIGRCLTSLQGVADEIIVVDSFSTDTTSDICKEYSARFELRKFEGYSAAKNYGNSLAQYPYILSIDADEALSDELSKSIQAAKQSVMADAYSFNRLTNYCGKWIRHCGWYPDCKIRLWRNELGGWQGLVHETLAISPKTTVKLRGDLLHYSYYNVAELINQTHKYATIAAGENHTKGRKMSTLLLAIRPLFIFVKKYFIQQGFRDGYDGFVISTLSAYGTFLKDIQLRQLNNNQH